jgi:hypothetical protein
MPIVGRPPERRQAGEPLWRRCLAGNLRDIVTTYAKLAKFAIVQTHQFAIDLPIATMIPDSRREGRLDIPDTHGSFSSKGTAIRPCCVAASRGEHSVRCSIAEARQAHVCNARDTL